MCAQSTQCEERQNFQQCIGVSCFLQQSVGFNLFLITHVSDREFHKHANKLSCLSMFVCGTTGAAASQTPDPCELRCCSSRICLGLSPDRTTQGRVRPTRNEDDSISIWFLGARLTVHKTCVLCDSFSESCFPAPPQVRCRRCCHLEAGHAVRVRTRVWRRGHRALNGTHKKKLCCVLLLLFHSET